MGIRAGDVFGRNPDGSFEITPCDADQAGIFSGKHVSHWLQSINQSSEHGIDGTLMPNAFQQCRLLDRVPQRLSSAYRWPRPT